MARPRKPQIAAVAASYVVATDRAVWDANGAKFKGEAIALSDLEATPLVDAGLIKRG